MNSFIELIVTGQCDIGRLGKYKQYSVKLKIIIFTWTPVRAQKYKHRQRETPPQMDAPEYFSSGIPHLYMVIYLLALARKLNPFSTMPMFGWPLFSDSRGISRTCGRCFVSTILFYRVYRHNPYTFQGSCLLGMVLLVQLSLFSCVCI